MIGMTEQHKEIQQAFRTRFSIERNLILNNSNLSDEKRKKVLDFNARIEKSFAEMDKALLDYEIFLLENPDLA